MLHWVHETTMYYVLLIVHFFYSFICALRTFLSNLIPRHSLPYPSRIPSHLALVLVPDLHASSSANGDALIECVLRAVLWCQEAGIPDFTVYDPEGKLVAIYSPHWDSQKTRRLLGCKLRRHSRHGGSQGGTEHRTRTSVSSHTTRL